MTLVAHLESCNYRPKKVGGPCTNYKVPTVSQIQMYEQEQVHSFIDIDGNLNWKRNGSDNICECESVRMSMTFYREF